MERVRQIERQTDGEADRLKGKEAERQRDRQIESETVRE